MSSTLSENRVYVGAYGFCLGLKGRLLLARLSKGPDAGFWTLPGGGVLWGEDPARALFREMEEETGLVDLQLRSIQAINSHTYPQIIGNPLPPLHHIGIIYQLIPNSYTLLNETDGSTDLCSWVTEKESRALPLTPLGRFGVNLAWGRGIDPNLDP